MCHFLSCADREGSPSQLFYPRRNPTTALPIHLSPHLSPHPPVPCQDRQQCKLWRDFSRNWKQFTSSLLCVVPPPAASCHGSLLFSQEISQTSPEVDLVHSKISACQGVLRLLHSFVAQCLSRCLSPHLSIWPLQLCHLKNDFRAVFFLCFIWNRHWSDTRYVIECICWLRNQLTSVLSSSYCPCHSKQFVGVTCCTVWEITISWCCL